MNIYCISLERMWHINGRLNSKDIYCVLPKFHQQVKKPFGFTILRPLDFHLCAFLLHHHKVAAVAPSISSSHE